MTPRRLRAVAAELLVERRPGLDVERSPQPGARERVVDVLVELLDARRHSGRS